jgi:hypothetical protein
MLLFVVVVAAAAAAVVYLQTLIQYDYDIALVQ